MAVVNAWLLAAGIFAFGLWVRWGNHRIARGKRPPEDSTAFAVVLVAVLGAALWAAWHTGVLR